MSASSSTTSTRTCATVVTTAAAGSEPGRTLCCPGRCTTGRRAWRPPPKGDRSQHDEHRPPDPRRRSARAGAVRGKEGDRRAGPRHRALAGVPPRPRSLPARGRARPGEDARGRDVGRGVRRVVRPPELLPGVPGGPPPRLQFTPDLLPADIVGTRVYRASSESFDVELGPLF